MSVRVLPLPSVAGVGVATVEPGGIFGNHFHETHQTLLVLGALWTLVSGDGSAQYDGPRAIEIDPGSAYAIRNDGATPLQVVSLENAAAFPRQVIAPLTRIAGVDGCRHGWLAVIHDGDALDARLLSSDEDLVALFASCAVAAIDIPIGLAERGSRACDVHARTRLEQKSSVFPAPLRALIHLREYAEVNRTSRELQGRGVSRQAFGIYPKVAQVDRVLQRHHELRRRVYEIHPEVSFTMWNRGVPMPASKHTRAGIEARRELAQQHFGELPPTPRGAREDDLLDALAALWTAQRIAAGVAQELGDAHVDVTGLPMRIVY